MKEKFKLSTFMIDNLLNEYYVGIENEYLGYEAFINDEENDVIYQLLFKTYCHGKETILIIKLSKGKFAQIISDALEKIKGFNNPYVKITVRENSVGYQVDYDINDKLTRRKNRNKRDWK